MKSRTKIVAAISVGIAVAASATLLAFTDLSKLGIGVEKTGPLSDSYIEGRTDFKGRKRGLAYLKKPGYICKNIMDALELKPDLEGSRPLTMSGTSSKRCRYATEVGSYFYVTSYLGDNDRLVYILPSPYDSRDSSPEYEFILTENVTFKK